MRDIDVTTTIDLRGQIAIVTGAGAGIGEGIAEGLAAAGATVAVFDRISGRAERVAENLRRHGVESEAVTVDVLDFDALVTEIERVGRERGRLDILVNNAGGGTPRLFQQLSPRSRQRHLDLNLGHVLVATAAAIPTMIAGRRGGSVINVTSIEGERAAPGFAVYAAAKAGVNSLTKSLALELGLDGIRVNAIAPDHTATPGVHGADSSDPSGVVPELSSEQELALRRLVPIGREGFIEECGAVAAFLASKMAAYITGVVVPVDGGTAAAGGWQRGRDSNWQLAEGYRFGERMHDSHA